MIPVLNVRWKLYQKNNVNILKYYGDYINYKKMTKEYEISSPVIPEILSKFDGITDIDTLKKDVSLSDSSDIQELEELIKNKVIVDVSELQTDYRECTQCANNNKLILDLGFDENGVCDYCNHYKKNAQIEYKNSLKGLSVQDADVLKDSNNEYDAMILYTGGKDSSLLLWHLTKNLGMRVVAATWNMPFMSDSARKSIENAKKRLPEVKFIEVTLPDDQVIAMMKASMYEKGLPCICHFMAKLIFYPIAIEMKIPYIVDGVEEIQTTMFGTNSNVEVSERDITFAEVMKILRSEPFLKRVTKPTKDQPYYSIDGVKIDILKNQDIIKKAFFDTSIKVPIIKHLANCTERYTWHEAIDIIKNNLGWQPPDENESFLHTSCKIEYLMDYTQMRQYLKLETSEPPESIIQLNAGIYYNYLSRDAAKKDLSRRDYFKAHECIKYVKDYLSLSEDALKVIYS